MGLQIDQRHDMDALSLAHVILWHMDILQKRRYIIYPARKH